MSRTHAFAFATAFVLVAPAAAQDTLPGAAQSLTEPGAIASSADKASKMLADTAKDKMLVEEMLGSNVTGPGGETIGTIDNLVVIPGGRIVAVLVKPQGEDPIAVPYQALKVSAAASAADKRGFSLPMSLDEAKGMQSLQDLTGAAMSAGE